MDLPAADIAALQDRAIPYNVGFEAGMLCVTFPAWKLPSGYNRDTVDLLLRLQPGYPDLPPDMWWVDPELALFDGRIIQATEVRESYLARTWQRWSRHLTPQQWQSGIDGIETYLAVINREFARCAEAAA